jgi:hypothetical protein
MVHFDMIRFRPSYDVNLFGTLRNLMPDSRKLVLLLESRQFFANIPPADHPNDRPTDFAIPSDAA